MRENRAQEHWTLPDATARAPYFLRMKNTSSTIEDVRASGTY